MDVVNFNELTWIVVMFLFTIHGICGSFMDYGEVGPTIGPTNPYPHHGDDK